MSRYGGLGDRHQQNGVNYTLDLNAGLTQVLSDSTNTYLYGNGRISQHATQTEYFLGDALGSVRQLVDTAGAVTFTQSYAPYGKTVSSIGTGASPYQFTGEMRDANGLTYLRARYYNSGDGRFLTRDTWNGDYNRPLSLNRWNYVEGNPVNLVDPSGHCKNPDDTVDFWKWPWGSRKPCPNPPTLGGDTAIIDMPWLDEQSPALWDKYPNSCGASALFMFLKGEGVQVTFEMLVQQLHKERPGGYDGYCCDSIWNAAITEHLPTPTPAPTPWCNKACVSAEALASVARTYGLDIASGDNWTHEGVYKKLSDGHPVLTLVKVGLETNTYGHFVVIRGFINQGWTVVYNDSYPGEEYWDSRGGSSKIRRQKGVAQTTSWGVFDASWASNVDKGYDDLAPNGHVRWAMSVK